jgi:hypothetical protein
MKGCWRPHFGMHMREEVVASSRTVRAWKTRPGTATTRNCLAPLTSSVGRSEEIYGNACIQSPMTNKLLISLSCGLRFLREVLWLDAHDCKGAKDGANLRVLALPHCLHGSCLVWSGLVTSLFVRRRPMMHSQEWRSRFWWLRIEAVQSVVQSVVRSGLRGPGFNAKQRFSYLLALPCSSKTCSNLTRDSVCYENHTLLCEKKWSQTDCGCCGGGSGGDGSCTTSQTTEIREFGVSGVTREATSKTRWTTVPRLYGIPYLLPYLHFLVRISPHSTPVGVFLSSFQACHRLETSFSLIRSL